MKAPLYIDWCPQDALQGTELMDPLEELVYRRLLDYIYMTGDALPDNDTALARMTKAGNRWKRIKASLIALGKIKVSDGRITNEKCEKTLEKVRLRIQQRTVAGELGNKSPKRLKNNNSRSADAVADAGPDADACATTKPITHLNPLNPPSGDFENMGGRKRERAQPEPERTVFGKPLSELKAKAKTMTDDGPGAQYIAQNLGDAMIRAMVKEQMLTADVAARYGVKVTKTSNVGAAA